MKVRDLFLMLTVFSLSVLIGYNSIFQIPDFSKEYILEGTNRHQYFILTLNIPPREISISLIPEGEVNFKIEFIDLYGKEEVLFNKTITNNQYITFNPDSPGFIKITVNLEPTEKSAIVVEVTGNRIDINIYSVVILVIGVIGYSSMVILNKKVHVDYF